MSSALVGLGRDEAESVKWLRRAGEQGTDRAGAARRPVRRGEGGIGRDPVEDDGWYRLATTTETLFTALCNALCEVGMSTTR